MDQHTRDYAKTKRNVYAIISVIAFCASLAMGACDSLIAQLGLAFIAGISGRLTWQLHNV